MKNRNGQQSLQTKSLYGVQSADGFNAGWTPLNNQGAHRALGLPNDFELICWYYNNSNVSRLVDKDAKRYALTMSDSLTVKRMLANGTLEELEEHPVIDLLETVNESINGFDLWYLSKRYRSILGYVYWVKRRGTLGAVEGIDIPVPWKIKPVRDSKGYIVSYEQLNKSTDTRGIPLKKEDVIAIRNHALIDPYGGADSALRSAFREVMLSNAWADYQVSIIKNRRRPDWLLVPKIEGISPEDISRYEAMLEQKVGSIHNNGKPIVLDAAFSVVNLAFTPTDLAGLEVNKEVSKALCNVIGIPPALEDKDANFANMNASLRLWDIQSILPEAKKTEQDLNAQLMPDFGDGATLCFEDVVEADNDYEVKIKTVHVQALPHVIAAGGLTVDELREFAGLDPIAGGSAMVEAPAPQPAANAAAKDPDSEDAADDDDDEQQAEDEGKSFDLDGLLKINEAVAAGRIDRATAINLAAKSLGLEQSEAKNLITFAPEKQKAQACGCSDCLNPGTADKKSAAPTTDPNSTKLASVVRDFFSKQRGQILARLGEGKSGDVLSDIAGALSKVTKALPSEFVPLDEWDEELDRRCQPVIELIAKTQARETLTRVGASPDIFAVLPAKIDEAVAKASLKFAKSTNETTSKKLNAALDQLREELRQGLSEGDGIRDMRKRVNEIFEGLDKNHAELIAQTETQRAIHEGQKIAAIESGVVKGFKFLVSSDACDDCLALEGKEIGLEGKFFDDDYGDGLVPVHPGCRCTMTEVLKDSSNEGE